MQTGKISESMLNRYVLQPFNRGCNNKEVVLSPGMDSGILPMEDGKLVALTCAPLTITSYEMGRLAVIHAVNNLACAGAKPRGVLLTVLMSESTTTEELEQVVAQVDNTCAKLHIQVYGGHTEVTSAVKRMILCITGVGYVKDEQALCSAGNANPGQDILITKYIGLEGTWIIARERENILKKRFPAYIIEEIVKWDRDFSVEKEARYLQGHGAKVLHDISEGGIYRALWNLSEESKIGFDVDLHLIPVRQETIELCEVFGMNPYRLISGGSLMAVVDNGQEIVEELQKTGIHAVLIGKTTSQKKKAIHCREEEACLDRPKVDEIYKIMEAQN